MDLVRSSLNSIAILIPLTLGFGIGTAAVVCPVERIGYQGRDIHIPTGTDGLGPITKGILDEITGRQLGTIPSDWSVVVPPKETF